VTPNLKRTVLASPQPLPQEGLEIQQIKSPSLLGEGDLGGEADTSFRGFRDNKKRGCENSLFFVD
jgi:hypothetical protein